MLVQQINKIHVLTKECDKLANNIGYLTSSKTPEHQELYTPYYAVEPIVKYIPKSYRIWCPFDAEWSSFYQTFRENGFDVIRSHIDEGKDFFLYEPDDYDVIISNPPFNIKDQILERLYNLNKPFAVLLPLNTLQGKTRCKYFKNGIQILSFDQRIGFHNRQNMNSTIEGSPFATAYFCKDFLPNDLIVEKLEKYEKGLLN